MPNEYVDDDVETLDPLEIQAAALLEVTERSLEATERGLETLRGLAARLEKRL